MVLVICRELRSGTNSDLLSSRFLNTIELYIDSEPSSVENPSVSLKTQLVNWVNKNVVFNHVFTPWYFNGTGKNCIFVVFFLP